MKRYFKLTGITLLGIIALVLLYAYIVYPAEYVNRVLIDLNQDVRPDDVGKTRILYHFDTKI